MPIDFTKPLEVSLQPSNLDRNQLQTDSLSAANSDRSEALNRDRLETFIPEPASRCLSDLIVPSNVRAKIEVVLNRIRYHDKLYHEWNLKKIDPQGRRVAINLFGLPGTGKTFCAEAIASYLAKPIIKVNYAEIESKYVGETPKNIVAAFQKASQTDSVLFFDEADSILGKRLSNVTQSADHGVNVSRSVMLLQLDRFDGVVIFASNLPENYDGAFERRILAHIEFELPDRDCLVKLWDYLLPVEIPGANDLSRDWLAEKSEGLAGGDILNVVKLAASQAVARPGEECRVLQSDIWDAIVQVRTGKEKIGSSGARNKQVSVTEQEISPDELPLDVRDRYDRVTAELPLEENAC